MSVPLVSIVIPCHNAEAFVGDAVSSALGQTWSRKEVVVVDDGSTDGTCSVLERFDDQVRWETGPNRGACAARNRGLALCRGDYVQFLDADDMLHPQKVARSMEQMVGRQNILVYSRHRIIAFDSREPDPVQWNRSEAGEDAIPFMLSGDLPTPAPLHARPVVEHVGGFDESLPCAQDRDFHLKLALAGVRFLYLPDVLFTIRRRSGSIGTSNPVAVDVQRAIIAERVFSRLVAEGRLTTEYRTACAAMMLKAARGMVAKEPQLADTWKSRALDISPGSVHRVYSLPGRLVFRIFGFRRTESLASCMRSVRDRRVVANASGGVTSGR